MGSGPTLAELIRTAIETRLLDVHTAIPGRVLKYDDANGTVDVLPVVKRRISASEGGTVAEELPAINGVRVAWQGSTSCYIKFQIPKGSHVLLIFNEACISGWRDTGQVSEPGDLTRHDLSYPFAVPCGAPDAEEPSAVGAAIVVDGPLIKLGEGAAEFIALATKVLNELNDIRTKFDAHIHTTTATIGLGPGVGIISTPTVPMGAASSVAAAKAKAE